MKMPFHCQNWLLILMFSIVLEKATIASQEILDDCFNNAVGVANQSIIPDDQMTASSNYSNEDYPFYGRLNGSRLNGWCASDQNVIDSWLQVDLGKAYAVCGVATQGGGLHSEWVIDFKLNFSSDGNVWTTYKYENGTEAEFHREGNNTIVDHHKLPVPVSARYIRFRPTSYRTLPCLRVEVYNINIDGGWTQWSQWSACSLTCGGGMRSHNRTCTNPPPQHDGKTCVGEVFEQQACNSQSCPVADEDEDELPASLPDQNRKVPTEGPLSAPKTNPTMELLLVSRTGATPDGLHIFTNQLQWTGGREWVTE